MNHHCRHAEILSLSSDLRIRMLLRWRESTHRQRSRAVDRASRSVECECGFHVSGHEDAQYYVTNGDSDKLVGDMMRGLSAISNAAFDMLIASYDNVLIELDVRKEAWDEAERKAFKAKQEDDEEVEMGEVKTNPY